MPSPSAPTAAPVEASAALEPAPSASPSEPSAAAAPLALTAEGRAWAKENLARLSVRDKAAQLVMVRAYGRSGNPRSLEYRRLLAEVQELGVGGLVLFASELDTIPVLLNELQAAAALPLLVSSDLERGLAFRVERGAVPLPHAMAFGAAGSEEAARFAGEVTAREARAVGIHWALAPVVDVNNNPGNPVVNIRSYGEDPQAVARLGAAFIRGARAGGVLTSAKHFPGHGDTATDSHLATPSLPFDRARLERVEFVPFRAAIAAGVDSVMLGHIAVPAIDPSGAPATLSKKLGSDLLRGEMGFQGLIVTDALEMTGIRPAWAGEAVVKALLAGADVILLPADPRVAIDSMVRAVAEGRLPLERLDEAALRVLESKARVGLHRQRRVEHSAIERDVARPEDVAQAMAIARQAITVVKNQGGILPLAAEKPLSLLHLVLSSDFADGAIRGIPEVELELRGIEVDTVKLGVEMSEETAARVLRDAPRYDHVLVSAFVRVSSSKGTTQMVPSQAALVRRLAEAGTSVLVVSYGSPYLLSQFPTVPVYLCALGWSDSSQRAVVAALLGEGPSRGKLPVTIPGQAVLGQGLEVPARQMGLAMKTPEEMGMRPDGMAEVDAVLASFLEKKAFPGGVVAVGYRGALVHLAPFGKLSYDWGAREVTAETLYDLASLTKVIATTTMAMILVDEGRLELDKAVVDFLPGFVGPGKEKVTVRHLLTHSSGIDWWAPLYKDTLGKAAYVEKIQAMPLVYEPGTQSKYSDLGVILLGEILERVAGVPLDAFVKKRVFEPLGMSHTGFLPGAELLAQIAPTEEEKEWRQRVIHGEVHDENAHALGGVAPHAGLFGTAGDLARFAQMLVNGGVFEHHRIVSRQTFELFTRRAALPGLEIPGSTRALGWDTKSPEGSSAGTRLSPLSFGHTGFTGTSMWIDPERELFVILLTNRVHPTRENQLIREARPALADAVVRALNEPEGVRVGLDRVASGEAPVLEGKRVGLVTHAAAFSAEGHSGAAVLRARGIQLVKLFSPEHGLTGTAAAGEKVKSGTDPATGLPLVSLYGDHKKPTPADLAGLDVLVVDLQDAGVRFYTYASTLLLCLEAAAEQGVELVVLDRPNPLGGVRVEGPTADRSTVPASFVNMTPGPLVHGLTLGELARYANARREKPARLTVVPMVGWRRSMSWQETGRPWVPPSPNLKSPEAALAYPGVALLEATNVSEGRGSEEPFLRLGAPWLDPSSLAISLPGFALTTTRFTPRASTIAPSPKYNGQEIGGLAITLTDPHLAQPYRLGVELLKALSRQNGFRWNDDGAGLARLMGTKRLLAALKEGRSVAEILAADREDHEAWRQERRTALLY